jgi:hypothetical protein
MCRQASLCTGRDNANARRASIPASPVEYNPVNNLPPITVPRTYDQKDNTQGKCQQPITLLLLAIQYPNADSHYESELKTM